MGLLTFQDFQNEVSDIIGVRSEKVSDRISRWINFGYFDLTGAVEFDELTRELMLEEDSDEDGEFLIPPGVRSIIAVKDQRRMLSWLPPIEFFRISFPLEGEPEVWTRMQESILVSPLPADFYSLLALTKFHPDPLETDSDRTILPSTWDLAILYLSASHAFFSLGEDQRGVLWLNRAASYITTRAVEEKRKIVEPGLGATLPLPKERLAVEGA